MTDEQMEHLIERWSGMTPREVKAELLQIAKEDRPALYDVAQDLEGTWLAERDTPYDGVIRLLETYRDGDDDPPRPTDERMAQMHERMLHRMGLA